MFQEKFVAHSLSAKKRIRQNIKSRSRNRGRKARIHELEKAFDQALLRDSDPQTNWTDWSRVFDRRLFKKRV